MAALASLALPAPGVMVTPRSKYCENGSSKIWAWHALDNVAAANNPMTSDAALMGVSLVQWGCARPLHDAEHISVRSFDVAAGRNVIGIFLLLFHLAHQEEVD